MLVNAQKPEELRVAVVSDGVLEAYQIEVADKGLIRGNIYRGIIANIEASLNAAFIDYGATKDGFLAAHDVMEEARYKEPPKGKRPRIDEILERGKPIVVQVTRDPEGKKGAALTTNLSLAGRYLVLTPFDSMIGVSRKVEDDAQRKELKEIAAKLDLPDGCGVIVRTNARDQNLTVLRNDLKRLLRLWKQIQRDARKGRGPKLLYSDQDLVLKAFRDLLDSDVDEVLVDDEEAFERAEESIGTFFPRSQPKLELYSERMPLFSKFELEPQIEAIYQRKVSLPSGGSIVIEGTEALTAVDVNSGRATKKSTHAETALQTNLEAAAEVARQLRLRDIGGLIVVDFIDMRPRKHQKKVERALREEMKSDRARTTIGRISSNGLLEINRQRISQALEIRTHRACPTCDGTGNIASPEMVSLSLLRRIEARAASGRLAGVRIELHPELADAFQNERRREIADLEEEFDIAVEVIASSSLHRAEERIRWRESDEERPRERRRRRDRGRSPAASSRGRRSEKPEASAAAKAAAGESGGGGGRSGRGRGSKEERSEPKPQPSGGAEGGEPRRSGRSGRRRGRSGTSEEGDGSSSAATSGSRDEGTGGEEAAESGRPRRRGRAGRADSASS